MAEDNNERVAQLLEKLLMVQLYKMGLSQSDIAKMLNKRAAAVNAFLKPLAKKEKS